MNQIKLFASLIFGIGISLTAFTSPADGRLLIGNTRSNNGNGLNIVSFDEVTGEFLGEFIPAGLGGLGDPDDLTIGPDGNLYISSGDNFNTPEIEGLNGILRYNLLTGAFIDVFATSPSLNRPYGNAFGPDGRLYVASFLSDEILRYNGTTGEFIDVFASGNQLSGGLNGPNDLLFGPDGSLYVTTQGSVAINGVPTFPGLPSQILKFDLTTGLSEVFVDQPTPTPDSFGFVSFLGLALGLNGELVTSDFANGIRRYNLTTGALIDEINTNYTGTTPSNNFIGNITFSPDGTLFSVGFDFTQNNLGTILRYDGTSGNPLPSAGNTGPIFVATNPNLVRPIGIVFAPSVQVPEPQTLWGMVILGVWFLTKRSSKL